MYCVEEILIITCVASLADKALDKTLDLYLLRTVSEINLRGGLTRICPFLQAVGTQIDQYAAYIPRTDL